MIIAIDGPAASGKGTLARRLATRFGLAFLDTGAYQDAGTSNFNAMTRPATVLVSGSGAELVKRAETIEDLFARDMVPQRLAGISTG